MPLRSDRVRVDAPAAITVPAEVTFQAVDGTPHHAAPRAILARILPAPLGGLLADAVFQRMSNSIAGPPLTGVLQVAHDHGSTSYRLEAAPPRLRIQGGGSDFTMVLRTGDGVQKFDLQGTFGSEENGTLCIPLEVWQNSVGENVTTFHCTARGEPYQELWARRDGSTQALRPLAVFTPHHPSEDIITRKPIATSNPLQAVRCEATKADPYCSQYRITNEVSTRFPRFSIRGGVYVGVGAAQNYDHLTAARSEAALLLDIDPDVTADHRGILALVGCARNASHFISMLFGVELTAAEENMPVQGLLNSLSDRNKAASKSIRDEAYQRQLFDEISPGLSPQAHADAQRIMREGFDVFFSSWNRKYGDGSQGQWLADANRFNHLQALQNAGRIVVRTADLAGDLCLPDLAASLDAWNHGHSPTMQINVTYLSNAEHWLYWEGRFSHLVDNLQRLPLNVDGVVLRTFGDDQAWAYQTVPAHDYLSSVTRDGYAPTVEMPAYHRLRAAQQTQEATYRSAAASIVGPARQCSHHRHAGDA